MKLNILSLIFLLFSIISCTKQEVVRKSIFVSGINGYDTYRIPAIVTTQKGTILAFCEGRKDGAGDAGNIDLLIKRSEDYGNSWSKQNIIWSDSGNTCGNPCPIVDRVTGKIHLLMTWNRGEDSENEIINETSRDSRRVFYSSSSDDGITWTIPEEITGEVKKKNWTWYATGPGAGIQLERGDNKGRLIAPCDHIEAETKKYFSHIIYSDDFGKSWQLGGSSPIDGVNECRVVEISNNRLMLNMRNYNRKNKSRQIAYSTDGGITWDNQGFDEELIEPICQASLISGPWTNNGLRDFLLFSNPADSLSRINMTIKVSKDEGNSWQISKHIYQGPSAYSDLTLINSDIVACLFESGEKGPYERIEFYLFPLKDLSEY